MRGSALLWKLFPRGRPSTLQVTKVTTFILHGKYLTEMFVRVFCRNLYKKNESSDWKTVSRLGSQVKLILDKKRKQAITNTSPKDTVKLLRESVNSRGSWTAATTLLWKTLWRPWDSLTHWFLQKCFLTNGLQPHMIYEKDSLGLLLLWRSKGFNDTNDASDVGCEVCSGAETCKRNANGQQGSWYSISQGDLHASKGGQQ